MIHKTFSDIHGAIQDFIHDDTAATLVVIKRAVNLEYGRLADAVDWPELRGVINESSTTTAGQAYLALPGDCAHVRQIANKTQEITYHEKGLENAVSDKIATFNTQGTPYFYSTLGIKPTKMPLAADQTIWTASEDALGVSIAHRVGGLNSNDDQFAESITSNGADGTTRVVSTATYRHGWSIDTFGTSKVLAYGLIMYDAASSGNEIARIKVGYQQSRYYIIQFEQPPSSTDNLHIIYKKSVPPMINNDDLPMIPVADVLIEAAIGKMRQFDEQYSQSSMHKRDASDQLAAILSAKDLQREQVLQMRPRFRGRGIGRAY